MSAISRAITGRGKKPPAPPAPLIEPPPSPSDATPSIPEIESVSVEETIRRDAARKKEKRGRSGTLLTGARGLEGAASPPTRRKTLLGY